LSERLLLEWLRRSNIVSVQGQDRFDDGLNANRHRTFRGILNDALPIYFCFTHEWIARKHTQDSGPNGLCEALNGTDIRLIALEVDDQASQPNIIGMKFAYCSSNSIRSVYSHQLFREHDDHFRPCRLAHGSRETTADHVT